ncbi:MAG: phospholipase A [Kangiellaceae bacterium]|nr:phospholipase A [Kangiellaceae bacterium]
MKQSHLVISLVCLGLYTVSTGSRAESEKQTETVKDLLEQCYAKQIAVSDDSTSVKDVQDYCMQRLESENIKQEELSPLRKRIARERANRNNPNVISSHKRNYFLPLSYVSEPNIAPYQEAPESVELDQYEAKFQLSFKAPVMEQVFTEEDTLFFGFTLQSYWQMYNTEVSSPFRETNYQPELFYAFTNDFSIGEWTNLVNVIGIEHQSNGRSQMLSRSWNRIYAQFVWENNEWVFMFKPWYRLPEDPKTEPGQADGDDNPDIDEFMGHFEFTSVYQWDQQTFGIMIRNNLDTGKNRGAVQLDWTFPMGSRFKGYLQIFNGYGESLIDYNHSNTRIGLGVLLTDVF